MQATKTSSSLERTAQVIGNLKKLPDGWGGNMTKKPATKAVNKTKKILSVLESGHMPWPSTTAMPNGNIVLTWMSLSKEILVTVDRDGLTTFITSMKKLDKDTGEVIESMESEGPVIDMLSIDYMMAWYCSDKAQAA